MSKKKPPKAKPQNNNNVKKPDLALLVGRWVGGRDSDFNAVHLKIQSFVRAAYTNQNPGKFMSLEDEGRESMRYLQAVLKAVKESGRSQEDKAQMEKEIKKALQFEGDKVKSAKSSPTPELKPPSPEAVRAPTPEVQVPADAPALVQRFTKTFACYIIPKASNLVH